MFSRTFFLALLVLTALSAAPSSAYDADCNWCGTLCSGVGGNVYLDNNDVTYTSNPTNLNPYIVAKLCNGNDNTNIDYGYTRSGITLNVRWTSIGNKIVNQDAPGTPETSYCCLCGPDSSINPASGTLFSIVDTDQGKCSGFQFWYYPQSDDGTVSVTTFTPPSYSSDDSGN